MRIGIKRCFICMIMLSALFAGCSKNVEDKGKENTNNTKMEDTNMHVKAKGYNYDEKNLNYKLVWSDEFDYEGAPNPNKWGYDIGGHGWGNNELQYYTEGKNATVKDGKLIIEARKEGFEGKRFTSTRLISKGKGDWLYGIIRVRAKLPRGTGTWPAIWMLPTDWEYGEWPDSGEIDICEHVGYDMNRIVGSVHTKSYNHTKNTQKSGTIVIENVDTEFHEYAVEWLPDKIKFFIDDKQYFEFNPSKYKTAPDFKEWPYDKRFHLLLNIAVGGSWGGANGVDEDIWPQSMEVDYVRVYQSDVINKIAEEDKNKSSKDIKKNEKSIEKQIEGVNLGGWLVLEKWMTPELYKGYNAEDEYHLLKEMGSNAQSVIKKHRDTFIVEDDFKWLSNVGINTIRIPIGHWIFDGKDPYIPCIEYLDWAMDMAEKYNIGVLVDIHAAKGCQNGFDNGGLAGICDWHTKKENIDNTIELVGKISSRYKDKKVFAGIQLLNEPRWDVPMDILKDYYTRGYDEARKYLSEDKYIVIHDGFRLKEWKNFMQDEKYKNVYLDTHMYHVFEEADVKMDINKHINKAAIIRQGDIKEMKAYFPIVVGEWSIGIHGKTLEPLGRAYLENAAHSALGNTQLLTYSESAGWFFWNYKLSDESKKTYKGWDFRNCVEEGWLPKYYK